MQRGTMAEALLVSYKSERLRLAQNSPQRSFLRTLDIALDRSRLA